MEKQFKVETFLGGDLAELYEAVMEQFEASGFSSLSEMNQALLRTGLLLHLTMLTSMGAIADERRRLRLEELAEKVGRENLMWEVVELARRHWKEGGAGSIDLQA